MEEVDQQEDQKASWGKRLGQTQTGPWGEALAPDLAPGWDLGNPRGEVRDTVLFVVSRPLESV